MFSGGAGLKSELTLSDAEGDIPMKSTDLLPPQELNMTNARRREYIVFIFKVFNEL